MLYWLRLVGLLIAMENQAIIMSTMSQFGNKLLDFWKNINMENCMKLEMEPLLWNWCMSTEICIKWGMLKDLCLKNNLMFLFINCGIIYKNKFRKGFPKRFLHSCIMESLILQLEQPWIWLIKLQGLLLTKNIMKKWEELLMQVVLI